ncbi:alpha-amylase family protein [Microbacterium aurum]|uniref:alpha-amylase n=1 Tax=Microbacterium aurum TaxID=36805 RepID=UPI0028E30975|nr:alpha-amylase family protein [Microbacterium aurum]
MPGRRAAGAAMIAVLAASALAACTAPVAVDREKPADAGVQLFQRPWTSIAEECESTIGPAGFAWVLTSPPQEHIEGAQWWTSYQPVSYRVDSKLGPEAEFADMVSRCAAVGVAVIADAVVNHMAGIDAGTGVAGTAFTHYDYPGLYDEGDFHHCGLTADDDIADYSSREQVQTCELSNLADLDTSSPHVRSTIVDYLQRLLDLGVAGFRIDAAKHMAASDVQAIVDLLPADTVIMSEVIRESGSEPVQPEEYTGAGKVFEFQYARDLGPGLKAGVITDPALRSGADYVRPLHVPAADAVVFVDNHDTERGEASVTYRDGGRYLIANALMLADDYGTPVVYSGYAFTDRDAGAPQDAGGRVAGWTCTGITGPKQQYADGEGVCTEAWTAIAGLLELRRVAADAPRLPGVGDGDVYGFERDGRALLLVNPSEADAAATVPVGLPDGRYCDVISGGAGGGISAGACGGTTVTVSGGTVTADVPAEGAIALHIGARLS